jgi:ABC-type molybdate transport system substrate-binding protein
VLSNVGQGRLLYAIYHNRWRGVVYNLPHDTKIIFKVFYIAARVSKQGFVILKNAKENSLAVTFKNFMATKEAMDILAYFGFAKKQ